MTSSNNQNKVPETKKATSVGKVLDEGFKMAILEQSNQLQDDREE